MTIVLYELTIVLMLENFLQLLGCSAVVVVVVNLHYFLHGLRMTMVVYIL